MNAILVIFIQVHGRILSSDVTFQTNFRKDNNVDRWKTFWLECMIKIFN